jgi:probable phosphoglycerate mutase
LLDTVKPTGTASVAGAAETAQIVADALGLPVSVDEGLREVDVGDWSGRVHSEIEALDPEGYERWQNGGKGWNGGESYEQMGERVLAAILRITRARPGQTLLIVTHGGSIRACRATAAGVSYAASRTFTIPSMGNCEVTELAVVDGRLAQAAG